MFFDNMVWTGVRNKKNVINFQDIGQDRDDKPVGIPFFLSEGAGPGS